MTDKEMIHKWLGVFGKGVDEKIIREHVTSYGNHLWHLFTWGGVSCITGDAARIAFDKLPCTEVICFSGGYSNSMEGLTTGKKLCANALDNSKESDIYIVATDFSWTYVRTHEASCGPFFCTKQ
ncbi:MAG: DUF4275 family protein [Eubacteriales bacterium]|nr:DUF4275 family protein [Eubacteriales bacterium]